MSLVICPRCNRKIDTLELWMQDTIDGLTCVECLTEEEFYDESSFQEEQQEFNV